MNALRQTRMPVRLGWERTKYHKQARRHTRFSECREVRFLDREDLSEQGISYPLRQRCRTASGSERMLRVTNTGSDCLRRCEQNPLATARGSAVCQAFRSLESKKT